MSVRAVVVPATPLLVPGAAGGAHVLGATRDLVAAALGELLAGVVPGEAPGPGARAPQATGGPDLLVLGPAGRDGARGAGTTTTGRVRSGRLRPSLAGAGVDDRWLAARRPETRGTTTRGTTTRGTTTSPWGPGPRAQVPASVALLCLATALEDRGWGRLLAAVDVVEVPAEPVPADQELVRDRMRRADAVVVGGDGPAVTAALEDVARQAGWVREVRSALEAHEHLPGRYDVTVWSAADRA